MRSTFHHLAKRGTAKTWYCVLAVPKDVQAALGGKHHLLRNLETTDRAIALARRNAALDEMEDAIRAARLPAKLAEVSEAAVTIAQDQDQPRRSARDRFYDRIRDRIPVPDRRTVEELHERYGPSVAQTFQGVAKGQATPLLHHVDTWLAEGGRKGPLSEKAKGQYRAALRRLEAWLLSTGRAVTIEAVDRQTAGLFISEMMIKPGIDRVTANSWISPCSSYWEWLDKRMGVHTSPWQGQGFSKPQRRNGDEKQTPIHRPGIGNASERQAEAPGRRGLHTACQPDRHAARRNRRIAGEALPAHLFRRRAIEDNERRAARADAPGSEGHRGPPEGRQGT